MIRRELDDAFLLIAQHDHALIAGQMAELFGNASFARPEPYASVIKGVNLHDCGWPIHDDEPTISKDGLPLDVFEVGREIALKVWTTSAERASAEDPYAGLLTSLHVLRLSVFATTQTPFEHEKFDNDDPQDRFEVNKFQHREIERQEKLRTKLGLRTDRPLHHGIHKEVGQKSEDQLTFNFRMLQAMDALSLAVCCTTPPAKETQDVMPRPGAAPLRLKITREENDIRVDPWPFAAGEIELKIPGMRVPKQTYANNQALRDAFAQAEAELLTSHVRPAVS